MELKQVVSKVMDYPLQTLTSNQSNVLKKLIAAVAAAIFTVISAGTYLIHVSRFFHDRKVTHLKKELEIAVDNSVADTSKSDPEQTKAAAANVDKVKELLSRYPEAAEWLQDRGNTPLLLHNAVHKNQFELVDALVANGFDVEAVGRAGSPLEVAIKFGTLDMVKHLVEKCNARVDGPEGQSKNSVYEASCVHDLKKVQYLVEKGANVNPKLLMSPLRFVAMTFTREPVEATKTIQLMMSKGAKLYGPDDAEGIPQQALDVIERLSKQ